MQHPNIMKLFEVLDQTSKCHLVMELCHGRNLYHYIKKRPNKCITEQEAIPIFRQIVSAVAYMHEHGLVHRDLKLENILINDAGGLDEVKIIDFGFATNCQAGHKLSLFCGTPCYMDPDLVKQRKYSGQGVDVWALGVILFLLVTGGVPFWGDNEAELFRRIGAAKYSLPVKGRTYSKNIRNLFAKIFQPNASKRISASEILNDPWLGKGAAPQKSNVIKKVKPVPKAEAAKEEEDKDDGSTHLEDESGATELVNKGKSFNAMIGELSRDPALKKYSDFNEVLNEEEMNNNDQEDGVQSDENFNEEDFDEGPGPGVYIPQNTIHGQLHEEKFSANAVR